MKLSFAEYFSVPFVDGGYERDGCDCYGLIRLIYKEHLGKNLSDYSYISAFDIKKISEKISHKQAILDDWKKTDSPKFSDICVLAVSGRPVHVGFVLSEKEFMHTTEKTGVVIEKFNSQRWKNRILGFYELKRE